MAATFVGFHSPKIGKMRKLYDVEIVKQDLLNHFATRKGERMMDCKYGFIGHDLIFDNDTAVNEQLLYDDAVRIMDSDRRVQTKSIHIQKINHGYVIEIKFLYLSSDIVETLIYNLINKTKPTIADDKTQDF